MQDFRLLRVASLVVVWLSFQAPVLHALSHGSTSSRSEIATTRWLENGLRLVTIASESQPELVSIRLVVEGGPEKLPPDRQYLPHLVEHLAFRALEDSLDAIFYVRSEGGFYGAYTTPNQVSHSFDLPAARTDRVLRIVRSQWDTVRFRPADLVREVRRIRHELASRTDPEIQRAAREHAPGTLLDRLQEAELEGLTSAETAACEAYFREAYVGSRMTLVVAGESRVLAKLDSALRQFGEIPRGTPSPESDPSGDLKWLHGEITVPESYWAQGFGFRLHLPEALPAARRIFLRDAFYTYLRERLALRSGTIYDLELDTYCWDNAEIWGFGYDASPRLTSRPAVHDSAVAALQLFCEASPLEWWRRYLDSWSLSSTTTRLDPVAVADAAEELVEVMRHEAALPSDLGLALPTPEAAANLAAAVLGSATSFYFVPERFRRDWSEFESDEDEEEPVLVSAAWVLSDVASPPLGIVLLVLLHGSLLYFSYLIVRDLSRWSRLRALWAILTRHHDLPFRRAVPRRVPFRPSRGGNNAVP